MDESAMTSQDGSGYPVPDPIDPGEISCFRVYVPRHTWYIGSFWTAYQYFTSWVAWARDPLHKGKEAAAVWRRAYDKARLEFERTGGACTMSIISIRSKPLNPCIIQFQTDDLVWHDGPDVSCCSSGSGSACLPHLRIGPDGSVQGYDATTDTWSNTAPGETIANNPTSPPPFPDDPEARCKAAQNYSEFIKDFLGDMLYRAGVSLSIGEVFLEAGQWLALVFGFADVFLEGIRTILEAIYAGVGVVNNERIAARDSADILCEIYNHTGPGGLMSADGIAAAAAELYAKGDAEPDDDIKWWYVHSADMLTIWGTTGQAKGALITAGTPGDCGACEWEVSIDFTVTDGHFQRYTADIGGGALVLSGKYIAGSGWRTERKQDNGSIWRNVLAVNYTFEPFHITYAKASWTADCLGTTPVGKQIGLGVESEGYGTGSITQPTQQSTCGDFETEGSNAGDWDAMQINGSFHYGGGATDPADVGQVTITKLVVRGTGPCPWPELL